MIMVTVLSICFFLLLQHPIYLVIVSITHYGIMTAAEDECADFAGTVTCPLILSENRAASDRISVIKWVEPKTATEAFVNLVGDSDLPIHTITLVRVLDRMG